MAKANKNAQCEPHTSDTVPPAEETSFEQESESKQEVSIRQHQAPKSVYEPYIEGHKTGLLMTVYIIDSSNGR